MILDKGVGPTHFFVLLALVIHKNTSDEISQLFSSIALVSATNQLVKVSKKMMSRDSEPQQRFHAGTIQLKKCHELVFRVTEISPSCYDCQPAIAQEVLTLFNKKSISAMP